MHSLKPHRVQLLIFLAVIICQSLSRAEVGRQGASGEEAKPYQFSREITDLSYLPFQGHSEFDVAYSNTSSVEEVKLSVLPYYSSDSTDKDLLLAYAYGISNNLSFGITEDIKISSIQNVLYGPASSSDGQRAEYKADGAGDPTVALLYRATEQTDQVPLSFDIGFAYFTAFQKAKGATNNTKGNAANGGDAFGFNLSIFRKGPKGSVRAFVQYLNRNKRTQDFDGSKVEISGGNQTELGLEGQIKANEKLALKASIEQISISSSENKSGTSTTSISSYNASRFGLGLIITAVPETLLIDFGLQQIGEVSAELTSSGSTLDDSLPAHPQYQAGVRFFF